MVVHFSFPWSCFTSLQGKVTSFLSKVGHFWVTWSLWGLILLRETSSYGWNVHNTRRGAGRIGEGRMKVLNIIVLFGGCYCKLYRPLYRGQRPQVGPMSWKDEIATNLQGPPFTIVALVGVKKPSRLFVRVHLTSRRLWKLHDFAKPKIMKRVQVSTL